MGTKPIRDGQGRPIGFVSDTGPFTRAYDAQFQPLGYTSASGMTCDNTGKPVSLEPNQFGLLFGKSDKGKGR